jgi:hypothetical protein
MGLSEFPDILSPVILHFGSHIGGKSLCDEISLICRSLQLKCLYLHFCQGLVMVNLLDNFLNPFKLLMPLASDFTKSL